MTNVIREDVVCVPAYYISGHRGRRRLWVVCDAAGVAATTCDVYYRMGYRHLKIYPIVLGDPITWYPTLGEQAGEEVARAR